MVNSEAIFQDITSWKRLTIYLIVTLTVAFSANGILVGLLYVFTFFTIKDGQIVVKIAFEEELGFDAVSLIYAIQLLIALLIIAISYVIVKVVLPKMRIK